MTSGSGSERQHTSTTSGTQFAADLKTMLPRVPLVAELIPFIDAGCALHEPFLGCELATPYLFDGLND